MTNGRRLVVAGGAVALVLAAAGAAGAVWLLSIDDVDATTTDAAAPRPVADRPPAHPTRLAWAQDLPAERLVVRDGYLVAAAPDGVAVHDLATGRERWHYRRKASGAHVEVVGDRVEVRYDRDRIRLDLRTGRVRDQGYGPDEVGSVEVVSGGLDGLRARGLAARDRHQVWAWSADPGCTAGDKRRSGDTLVIELRCPSPRLVALDVPTGKERWRTALPAGATLADADGDWLYLRRADGSTEARPLRTGQADPLSAERPGLPGTPTYPVTGGSCTVSPIGPEVRCQLDGGARTLAAPTVADGIWFATSSGDSLVLVSRAAGPSDRARLAIYHPTQSRSPVLQAELPGTPVDVDQLVYGRGVLVVADQDFGKVAVYTDP